MQIEFSIHLKWQCGKTNIKFIYKILAALKNYNFALNYKNYIVIFCDSLLTSILGNINSCNHLINQKLVIYNIYI